MVLLYKHNPVNQLNYKRAHEFILLNHYKRVFIIKLSIIIMYYGNTVIYFKNTLIAN